jgi:hypothetical protein
MNFMTSVVFCSYIDGLVLSQVCVHILAHRAFSLRIVLIIAGVTLLITARRGKRACATLRTSTGNAPPMNANAFKSQMMCRSVSGFYHSFSALWAPLSKTAPLLKWSQKHAGVLFTGALCA